MNIKRGVLLSIVFIIFYSCEKDEGSNDGTVPNSDYSQIEIEILNLVNQHRNSLGKSPLKIHSYLYELAINHTLDMIKANSIGHDGFKERADKIWKEIGTGAVAENVAAGQTSAQSVVNGWLNSKGHRENIEGNYNLIGIAARKNSDGAYFFTQIFFNYTE